MVSRLIEECDIYSKFIEEYLSPCSPDISVPVNDVYQKFRCYYLAMINHYYRTPDQDAFREKMDKHLGTSAHGEWPGWRFREIGQYTKSAGIRN